MGEEYDADKRRMKVIKEGHPARESELRVLLDVRGKTTGDIPGTYFIEMGESEKSILLYKENYNNLLQVYEGA